MLISEAAVAAMKPGSVIVDIAAEAGGNCALTVADEIVTTPNGVTIVGTTNLPSTMPADASRLYSRNVYALLSPWIKDGALEIDPNDDVAKGAVVARDGNVLDRRSDRDRPRSFHRAADRARARDLRGLRSDLEGADDAAHAADVGDQRDPRHRARRRDRHRCGALRRQRTVRLLTMLAVAAVTLGAINVFGGFAVTERMLQMFRRREDGK